jgi:hypothetical protein
LLLCFVHTNALLAIVMYYNVLYSGMYFITLHLFLINAVHPSSGIVVLLFLVTDARPSVVNAGLHLSGIVVRLSLVNVVLLFLAIGARPSVVNAVRPSSGIVVHPSSGIVVLLFLVTDARPSVVNAVRPSSGIVVRLSLANVVHLFLAIGARPSFPS